LCISCVYKKNKNESTLAIGASLLLILQKSSELGYTVHGDRKP